MSTRLERARSAATRSPSSRPKVLRSKLFRPWSATLAALVLGAAPIASGAGPATAAADDAPRDLTAERSFTNAVVLRWTDGSTTETSFQIEEQRSPRGSFKRFWEVADATETTSVGKRWHVLSKNHRDGVFRCYRVVAVLPGPDRYSAVSCAVPALPGPPSAPVLTSLADRYAEVTVLPNPSWEWQYSLYARRAGGAWTYVYTRDADQRSDGRVLLGAKDLVPERYYCFRVTATNPRGESAPTPEVCGTTKILRPAAPTGFRVTRRGTHGLTLAWVDASSTETSYTLFRRSPGSARVQLASWGALTGVTEYADSGLRPNTEYHYTLRVTNAGGSSEISVDGQTTPQAPAGNEITHTYWMQPDVPYQGVIPWVLNWNPGPPANAHLKSITVPPSENRLLHVMKGGEPFYACATPASSVTLQPGQKTTPGQIQDLFGSEQPHPPLSLVACVTVARPGQDITPFPINITYVRD